MRLLKLIVMASVIFCATYSQSQDPMKKEQIEKWSQYYQQRAKNYELIVEDGNETSKLELIETPVLRWHNPIRTTTHGECFVWTKDGRVNAVASLFSYPRNGGRRVCHAFNAFGDQTLVTQQDGSEFWRVAQADLPKAFKVPDSPPVAASPPLRMAQMRRIARGFSARSEGTEREEPRELRLLTSPLYRYSENKDVKNDGALFSFVMGTDPEILLLLESYQDESTSEWRFIAARHTHTSLTMFYKGKEVWTYRRGEPVPAYLSQHGVDRKPTILP